MMQSVGVLLLSASYFRAIRGMRAIEIVGVVAIVIGQLTPDPRARLAFLIAGGVFCVAFPALFAGAHFRALASRRTHLLLPRFAQRMLVAAGAVVTLLGLVGGVLAASATDLPLSLACVAGLAFFSMTFWIGFLPFVGRLGVTMLLIVVAQGASLVPSETWMRSPLIPWGGLLLVGAGWLAFARWFVRFVAQRKTFQSTRSTLRLPSDIRLPWSFVGTAEGTLLLGTGDGLAYRVANALIHVGVIPLLFFGGFSLAAGLSREQLLGNPVLAFLSLAYAFVRFVQLASVAEGRRKFLWLRSDHRWSSLLRCYERVLFRELFVYAAVLVLLLMSAALLYPDGLVVLAVFGGAWLTALATHIYLPTIIESTATRFWTTACHLLVLAALCAWVRLTQQWLPLAALAMVQVALLPWMR